MPTPPTPQEPRLRFDDGAGYEQMMGRWSAQVAAPFLAWLALPPGRAWVDVGCGNGAFTEQLCAEARPASVIGIDPSPAQLAFARTRPGTPGVRYLEGDAQALPLPDDSADAAVMALVLFFLPEPAQGLREMQRVVRPGGTVAAYHWDLAGGGFPLQAVLDALEGDGQPAPLPPSSWVSSLEGSDRLWREAGLLEVQTRQFEVERNFDSFDAYWRSAHGSPRLRDVFAALAPEALQRLRDRVQRTLGVADGPPIVLRARANAVCGYKG